MVHGNKIQEAEAEPDCKTATCKQEQGRHPAQSPAVTEDGEERCQQGSVERPKLSGRAGGGRGPRRQRTSMIQTGALR